jgi:phosphoglycerol transferase MdoB-like AlkP superfamily enzyme
VLHNNEDIYNLTKETIATTDNRPKFVFTHLHIPHYPYYFDHNGKEQPLEKLVEGNQVNKAMYVEYLQYGNKKYLELIDEILKHSKQPPVIILMGDHGFRHFETDVDPKYFYQNFVTLRLPGNNYTLFTDSLTNVNFFRVFLNTQFRQQLPLLKDSTTFIVE